MPRMSDAEKRKSHKRILDAAARLMRENGVGSTSVSDVMQAAGLTHGGFYRHFSSKDELVAAAFQHAVDDVVADLEAARSTGELDRARNDYIALYLSRAHLEDRGQGCPLAAMGPEIALLENEAKDAASAAIERMAGLLASGKDSSRSQGIAMMALLLGTITLARLKETGVDAGEVLDAGKTGVAVIRQHWSDGRRRTSTGSPSP